MIIKPCFGSKELSDKSAICRNCPYKIACKITQRRWKRERLSSL